MLVASSIEDNAAVMVRAASGNTLLDVEERRSMNLRTRAAAGSIAPVVRILVIFLLRRLHKPTPHSRYQTHSCDGAGDDESRPACASEDTFML